MSPTERVGNILTVNSDHFLLDGITLQYARYHAIPVKAENDADNFSIRNCIIRDTFQQLLKVSGGNKNRSDWSDSGVVENCIFEYSAGVGPQFYIGGIDALPARNWIVRNNTFRDIISPGESVAEHAIHFWDNSVDNVVEKNLIVNCDRGIGFGLGARGNIGGIIRNNMIYHAENAGRFADVGISLENSHRTAVYNNTIYHEHSYPNAIEYRFRNTRDVLIANNLTNRKIQSRSRATAKLVFDVMDASGSMFVDPSSGDLHLARPDSAIIDQATHIADLIDDFDGD